ncbi:alpha/beta hydrolase, partial [Mesorhizobium sp. M7A.F.Ca.MR.148.00.0.0]
MPAISPSRGEIGSFDAAVLPVTSVIGESRAAANLPPRGGD